MNGLVKWIGLTGHKEAGKDTAAQCLIDQGYVRIAFADPLRKMALAIDPLIGHTFPHLRLAEMVNEIGWDQAKRHVEVRRFLQRLGTEAGRAVLGPDVWVEAADREAGHHERVVFTDVRFDNEASYIRRNGGIVVEIVRPGKIGDGHESEKGISRYLIDERIVNSGSIARLHDELLSAVYDR